MGAQNPKRQLEPGAQSALKKQAGCSTPQVPLRHWKVGEATMRRQSRLLWQAIGAVQVPPTHDEPGSQTLTSAHRPSVATQRLTSHISEGEVQSASRSQKSTRGRQRPTSQTKPSPH